MSSSLSDKKVQIKEDVLEMLGQVINQVSEFNRRLMHESYNPTLHLSIILDKLVTIHSKLEALNDLRKSILHNIRLLLHGEEHQRAQLRAMVDVDLLGVVPLELDKVRRYLSCLNEDMLILNPEFNFMLLFLLMSYLQGGKSDPLSKDVTHPRDSIFMKLKGYGDVFLTKSQEERQRLIDVWKLF